MKYLNYAIFVVASFVARIRLWMLGRHAIGILYDTKNGLLVSGAADMYVGGNLGFRGSYDLDMLSSLEALISNRSRVLVLGSHIGAMAIPLAKKAAEVVIYEANPATFRLLQINLKLNDVSNCTAYNLAVGDRRGPIRFVTHDINSGGSSRAPDRMALGFDRSSTVEVEMVRLDEQITNPRFDLVLMDIEGSEYVALLAMAPILANCSFLQFEYYPQALDRVVEVSSDNLASLLAENFSEIRVQNSDERASREEFSSLFRRLRRRGDRVDILAVK